MTATDLSLPARPPMRAAWPVTASRLLFAALAGLLVARFAGWLMAMAGAIAYPDQLDYGEGIIWQQADLMLQGRGYKDIASLPHVVFHYPPVFHLTSGLLARLAGTDQLTMGRAVSAVSSLGAMVLVARLVWRSSATTGHPLARLAPALIAGLLAITFYPVAFWSPTDRVDMLAIFLTLAGASLALEAPERRSAIIIAAVLFVAALFTKQTMLAAPAAALAVLLLARPRAAWLGVTVAAVAGLSLFVVLQIVTAGGFLEHIVGYNINRLDLSNVRFVIQQMLVHPVAILLAYLAAFGLAMGLFAGREGQPRWKSLSQQLRSDPSRRVEAFALGYLGLTTLTLAAAFKSGASINYLIEWMFACCLCGGLLLRRLVADGAGNLRLALFVPVLLLLQLAYSPVPRMMEALARPAEHAEFDALVARVREASAPVIADNMVAVRKAGKDLYLETAIIAELTALGRWDETAYLEDIRNRRFAFFMTEDSAGDRLFEARYSRAVRAAIAQFYPRTEKLAGHTFHYPGP